MSPQHSSITPIFSLGAPRSGTTWLGNILKYNFLIQSPNHPLHYGVLESNVFKIHDYFGDFSKTLDYIRFLELFSNSDFFLLSGLDKSHFYHKKPADFYAFFLELMDQYAIKQGKATWTTKLDPFFYLYPEELNRFLDLVYARYDQVKLVAIQRPFQQYLKSYVHVSGPSFQQRASTLGNALAPFLGAARYYIYNASIQQLLREKDGLFLAFDELKLGATTIQKIADYLAIKADNLDAIPLKTNTSFSNNKRSDQKVKFGNLAKIIFQNAHWLGKLLIQTYERFKAKRHPLTYRLIRAQYFQEELIEELSTNNDIHLVESIKNKSF
ncbi:MAG: sulfotransferase [Bacteroidota bacterium]